jgi:hypothetical protein
MMLRSFPSLLSPSLWTFWNLNSDPSASGINNSSTKKIFYNIFSIFNCTLSKLDLLDVLNDKLGKFEQNLSNMQTEIGNIKSVQQKQAQTLQNEEKHFSLSS